MRRRGAAARPHRAAVQPHPGRGGGAGRPGDDHPRRPDRRDRHAGRAAAPDPDHGERRAGRPGQPGRPGGRARRRDQRHPPALRGGSRRPQRRPRPADHGGGGGAGVPATDSRGTFPPPLFDRTGQARSPAMTVPAFAGTGVLARLAFQRDRGMLAAWIYVITALIAGNSWSLGKLYPTAAARADLAASGGRNPALVFLYGRLAGDSLGAESAWRYGVWAAIAAALTIIFLVVRHTRADEEAGRGELVGSAAVGRLGPLSAALGVAVAASAVLSLLLFAALALLGLPAAGSALFALAITTCGLAFAAVAAVTAQLAAGARTARGAAIGVLGASYLLRAVADAAGAGGPGW